MVHSAQALPLFSMESTRQGPVLLRAGAVAIIAVEAVALIGVGVIYAARAARGSAPADMAFALAVLAVAMGAALAFAAWALAHGRSWPRGLAITWQLLQIAAGAMLIEMNLALGAAAIATGAVGAALVFLDARATASG
jgi:hypothetical protein